MIKIKKYIMKKIKLFYFFQTIPEVNKTMQFNKNMKAVKSI